ncbi:DUF4097 family beta strand repeat-containing protein [Longispora sp. K20-0274]|uniref:DUF4097 family beta strand repeat-containing protein n=1 Tax=Longispora sp. K20-0274 TaxID=3088255 RepID=UPI00399B6FC4
MTSSRVFAVGMVGLALVGTVAGCRIQTGDRSQVDSSYEVTEAATRLEVTGRAGAIKVTTGDGPIVVREHVTYRADRPATKHDLSDGVLRLTNDCRDSCEVDYTIRVPATLAAKLVNDEGMISVAGLTGDLEVRTDAGLVEGTGLGGRKVRVTADAGKVSLGFTGVPDDVTAKSTAGEVEIVLPAGTSYRVNASNTVGSRTVSVQTSDASTHVITASTDVGSLEIRNA